MRLVFISLVFMLFSTVVKSQDVVVVDGDSLILNGKEIRLYGIDAPEYNQTCKDNNKKEYNCGQKAKKRLEELVSSDIKCTKVDVDRYKRLLSVCSSNNIELNKTMVEEGWAVAYLSYTKDYEQAQIKAKNNKRGMWQGRFMKPELFRRLKKD